MTGEANREQLIVSTLLTGVAGAGLVYFGRRAQPGIVATLAATIGYGLITKAVSATVVAVLSPSGD
jgi:uncharacterized membrane protein